MENTVTNSFTPGNKCVFRWADFCETQTCSTTLWVKNIDTKFYENPTRGIVAETISRTEGSGLHFMRCLCCAEDA